nr:N-acetyltransferase [uncultured Cohaesibacter sp.]
MTHLSKIPTFTIRQASLDDFDAMGPLWHLLDGYHQGQDPKRFPGTPKDAPRSKAYIAELIHCADRALLVAEQCPTIEGERGSLIGLSLVTLKTCPPGPVFPVRVMFEIDNLVVDETCRRQGIARALLAASEEWAKENGASEMLLNVYAFNEGAKRFYESLGFQPLRIQMVHAL